MGRADQLSIVIPTYNSERTIQGTLDSLLVLEEKRVVEMVVSDDASTDGTLGIVNRWMDEHKATFFAATLLRNPTRSGISGNHKIAFDHVTSKYAMYIGADDLLTNGTLVSQLLAEMSAQDLRIAKINVEALNLPSGLIVDLYGRMKPFFRMDAKKQLAMLSVYGNFLYAGPGTVVDVDVLKEINGFDIRFRTFEDYPLFMNFLLHGHRIGLLNVRGVHWVRSMHSLSANGFKDLRSRFHQELKLFEDQYVAANMNRLPTRSRLLFMAKGNDFIFRICKKVSRVLRGFPA